MHLLSTIAPMVRMTFHTYIRDYWPIKQGENTQQLLDSYLTDVREVLIEDIQNLTKLGRINDDGSLVEEDE